jgi:hypothetical protein
MTIKRKWNWSAFLSCPIWSIYYSFHVGGFSLYLLATTGLLLLLAKSNLPIISQFSFLILMIFLLVEYFLYSIVSLPIIYTGKIFGLEVDQLVGSLVPTLFYMCYCMYVGIVSDEWLYRNKSPEELFIIKKNNKKWIVFGIIAFIPTVLMFNYILYAIVNETMRSFGP